MEKFIMAELADNEQVVLDVPIGHLLMRNNILRDGAGEVIFSIADSYAKPGVKTNNTNRTDALRIICQTPEKAETIAKVFVELAICMREAAKD